MAQTKRKPAAAKPAAKEEAQANTKPEAGGGAENDKALSNKPAEDPTPPDGDGQVVAQAPTTDASASAEANQQPGDGDPPAVSGAELYVRTLRKKPRRRSGIAFGPEAVLVTPAAYAAGADKIAALLAVLEDPALHAFQIDGDGNEVPVTKADIDAVRSLVAIIKDGEGDVGEALADLLGHSDDSAA